jgi:hypothetical protein
MSELQASTVKFGSQFRRAREKMKQWSSLVFRLSRRGSSVTQPTDFGF